MAPRKRISKIASRTVPPVVQPQADPVGRRSIGTQTDFDATGPAKRKKVQPAGRPLGPQIPPPQELATHLMPAVNPQAEPLPAAIMMGGGQPVAAIQPFVPGPNEKSCQALKGGAVEPADRVITPNGGERQMNYLKSLMTNRREEANQWDVKRLETLLAKINGNPPPRWYMATQMWLEVAQLEDRIDAYDRMEMLNEAKLMLEKEQEQQKEREQQKQKQKQKEQEQGKEPGKG
ncbi:uncharacterized protein LOC108043774 [Drosophila rhopaloa]|uniref:Uncharacterized protein n=1 Tax=Drosophila rhopaloa TaxID=1041015 RepID=A0ABM5JEI3_DRORH|nr:uncharacterized protein LOC108043774 [Drosophila rhopaloa]